MELLTVICNFHLLVNILVRGVYCQSFTSKPNSPVYQLKGQSVTLSWTYNTAGKTVTQVWWFHNNSWIGSKQPSGQTSVLNARHQVSGPATLTISNVQTKDYGEYECQVTFSSGVPPFITATAELIVVVRPSIILKTKTAQTLDEGASLRLLCVASGNPKPSYTWYKDSVKIQEDPNSSNYTITSANRNDAGKYRCEAVVNATTLGQYSVPYSVQVTVRFKPAHKVNSLSSNQTVLQGNDATFYCLTEAFPTATTYRWFKDDNQITNSANFEIFNAGGAEESKLTIKNAQNGTAGQYSCDGTNRVGTGERKTAFLLVNLNKKDEASSGVGDWQLNLIATIFCEVFTLSCNYKY